MKFNKANTVIGLAIMVLAIGAYLQVIPDKTTPLNYYYNLFYSMFFFAGAIVGIWGATKLSLSSSVGKTLLFLGLGQASYGIGLLIWVYFNLIAKIGVPYPSIADFFFILFISLIAIGCISLLKMVTSAVTIGKTIEGVVIFTISAVLIVGFIIKPDISQELTLLNKITNIAYPVGDTILFTLAYLTLRLGGGKINKGVAILVVGLLVQMSGDFLFTYRTANQIYWNGDISDLFFTISATLITLAIISIYDNFALTKEPEILA